MLSLDYSGAENLWSHLKSTEKPIVMYGTGDGADKILHVFSKHGITVDEIFVSDEFYRGKEFHGYKTCRYSDVSEKYSDFIIILAFAVFRDDLLSYVKELMKKHEVLAPYVPVFGDIYFTDEFLSENENLIREAYNCLEDDTSRKTFNNILKYRISGNPHYLFDCETRRDVVFKEIIRLDKNEAYADLGAYRGDTIEEFLSMTEGVFDSIVAFEPDSKNYKKCLEYVCGLSEETQKKIRILNMASWNKKDTLVFDGEGGRNSTLVPQKDKKMSPVAVSDLDSILKGDRCTYVKMDVEGAETETLEGMKETIRLYKPKLTVSAYHKTPDIITLPLKIKELSADYRIFLRHHTYIPDWETNYYCI